MIELLSRAAGLDVSRETYEKLEEYVALVVDENVAQNLIAASTVSKIWERHVIDSVQLIPYAHGACTWVDIGSGAGFPGMITAIVTGSLTTLVEPRRLRAEFLANVSSELGLKNVTVAQASAASTAGVFEVVTARAVAPAASLIRMTLHLSRPDTIWLLPKGKTAHKELDEVRVAWQGDFRLVPSRTDEQASILVGTNVRPWGKQ